MSQLKLLVNPTSGNGLGRVILDTPLNIPVQATQANNIQQQLESFLNPGDILIIAGGDGTLNLILNGLYKTSLFHTIKVALYPLGTGNDLAKALNITKCPIEDYLQKMISSQKCISLPIWQFNDHVFINYISWGIGAKIIADVNCWRRYLPNNKILTKGLYFISGLINFIRMPKFNAPNTDETLLSLILCNINFYGGGCYLGSEHDNAKPQLNCFKLKNRFDFFKMVISRLTRKPLPATLRVAKFEATPTVTPLQIDGEHYPYETGAIRCLGNVEFLV